MSKQGEGKVYVSHISSCEAGGFCHDSSLFRAVKARVVQRSDKDMTMRGIPYSSKTKSEIEASPDKVRNSMS